jgi:hypothetical protein
VKLQLLALALGTLLAMGCSGGNDSGSTGGAADVSEPAESSSESAPPPVEPAQTSGALAGPPRGPAGSAGYRLPPPAWIEGSSGSYWLGGTSFCWGEVGCADHEPPVCGGEGVPEFTLEAGEVVALHLRYEPSRLGLRIWPPEGSYGAEPTVIRLDAAADTTWEAPAEDSIVFFTAEAAEGHASYQACVRVRAPKQTLCTTEAEQRTGVPRAVIEPRDGEDGVVVPAVEGGGLSGALCLVLSVGLRVAIPSFASAPIDRLENIVVVRTTPSPGVAVEAGSVVTFEEFTGLIPSTLPPVPDEHPATVKVPALVGLSYSEAVRALEIVGLVPIVVISKLPPLPPEASVRGLDAYVVEAQSHEPGSELPYLTTNPSMSVVSLTLALKP